MLPKIAVIVASDRDVLVSKLGLSKNTILGYEGSIAKVVDLRDWIYSSINIARQREDLTVVVWDADQLSSECQAVLLKPMEEFGVVVKFILVVQNENLLSPTILSRGVVEYHYSEKLSEDKYWSEIRKCWSSGPSAIIAFVDQLSKDEAPLLLEEIILKLKAGLLNEVNQKRLESLNLALDCPADLKQTNINYKLSVDNFLINSWKLIKA